VKPVDAILKLPDPPDDATVRILGALGWTVPALTKPKQVGPKEREAGSGGRGLCAGRWTDSSPRGPTVAFTRGRVRACPWVACQAVDSWKRKGCVLSFTAGISGYSPSESWGESQKLKVRSQWRASPEGLS
jgi:hypothetical protein